MIKVEGAYEFWYLGINNTYICYSLEHLAKLNSVG